MSVWFKKVGVLLVLSLLFSSANYAEKSGKKLSEKLTGMTVTASVTGCDEDIKKYCDGLGSNSNKVTLCLTAYEDQLSMQCKRSIVEAAMAMKMGAAAIQYSARACEADADKHCLDVKPGEGRLVSCIKANESKVSKECVAALKDTGLWDMGK